MLRAVLVSVVVSSVISTLATLAVVSFPSPSRVEAQPQGKSCGRAPSSSSGRDLVAIVNGESA